MEEKRHDRAERGGGKRRHEPARNHGENARDAIDGAFTVPGAVGKRRAHRDHEGDVRGRERELQARRRSDEGRGHDEVHAGADFVEGQFPFARLQGLFLVTRADSFENGHGEELADEGVGVERRANENARGQGRAELLPTAPGRGGEVHRRADDAMGLLRAVKRYDHHETRSDEPARRCGEGFAKAFHREDGGVGAGRRAEDVPGVESRERNAHEVDEVVAGKSERERERARKDHIAHHVRVEERDERLEEDREADEATPEDEVGIVFEEGQRLTVRT